MKRRVVYRKVLPATQTLAFVALTMWGCPYIRTGIQHFQLQHHVRDSQPENAEFLDWYPSCIDAAMSVPEQAATGINFPAVLASVVFEPVARKLNLDCRRGDYFMHASTLLFVPVLWYGVGRLLDGKSLVRSSRLHLKRTLLWSLAGIVGAVTALAGVGFALNPEFPLLEALVMAWLVLAMLALLRRVRSSATA